MVSTMASPKMKGGHMNSERIRRLLAMVLTLGLAATPALSQPYPSKPVRLVVPFGAGGSTDTVARILAQNLSERIGQPVIVENRPGGDTIIATEAVAKAPKDGYTILFSTSGFALLPHTRKRLPFDSFKDFAHITQTAYVQYVFAVGPSVPATDLRALIALARSKPGELSYGSASEGGFITVEMFRLTTGTQLIHVPYKSAAQAAADVLGGQVSMMVATFAGLVPHFKAGRLKPLAVSGARRSPALPEVPTVAEAGVDGFESSSSWGISAPSGTPRDAVMKLNGEIRA